MTAATPNPKPSRSRRRRVIVMGTLLLLLVVALFYPQAYSLRLPENPDSTWLLFLLSTLGYLSIVILTFVLARQIVKLYAERRANVLGSRFKTRLVMGALALSLTPVVAMFVFTYGLLNRTLDKWFSQPVVNVRDDNQSVLDLLNRYVRDNAQNEALLIAHDPTILTAQASHNWSPVSAMLARHRVTLEGGFAVVIGAGGKILAAYDMPPSYHPGRPHSTSALVDHQPYVLTRVRIAARNTVEVGMPVPATLTRQLAQLARDRDRYDVLARDRHSLKLIYTGYLLLLTLAILFVATWMALYLSRAITVPIAELASATQEIARGNLAYRVRDGGQDEIGTLVSSFNRMADDLEGGRRQIEASRQQLQTANQELETRRQYTEALLENTPSAVISLDRDYGIERVNPAVERLFGTELARARRLTEMFDPGSLSEIQHLLRKSERWPQATGQMEVNTGGRARTIAVTVAALPTTPGGSRRAFGGYVIVLDDLTDLLRIQKTAAWREVAQRIAHEIKNPLTPIALSAERIRRRLTGGAAAATSPSAAAVIAECADTIETEVRSLQRLVDEFSAFARFPRTKLVACDLNEVIERALRAFDGRLEGIDVRTQLDPLPKLQLDPEGMRRVFVNLIDNAAEAMQQAPYRQITISTQNLDTVVEVTVTDTGHGLPAGDKQRLFVPYFSTKSRGSGLGLAIVQRIIEDNGGSLRAEDNTPLGARFIIELPTEEAATVSA